MLNIEFSCYIYNIYNKEYFYNKIYKLSSELYSILNEKDFHKAYIETLQNKDSD